MSHVILKRFQQGVFEALASQNRPAGSGGGSGMGLSLSKEIHGGNSLSPPNPGKAFTVNADTLITDGGTPAVSAQLTVVANRAMSFLLIGVVSIQGPSAGAQGGFIDIYVDGSQPSNAPFANFGNTTGVSTLYQTLPILYVIAVQPGSHTIALKINTNNATYTVFSFDIYTIALN